MTEAITLWESYHPGDCPAPGSRTQSKTCPLFNFLTTVSSIKFGFSARILSWSLQESGMVDGAVDSWAENTALIHIAERS